MTFDYIPLWSSGTAKVEGSAQRIQEDTMRFAKIVESLGLQIVRAIMTLIAFTPILWGLSEKVEIEFLKNIPGSLVWVAFATSLGSLLISWFVGIKLHIPCCLELRRQCGHRPRGMSVPRLYG